MTNHKFKVGDEVICLEKSSGSDPDDWDTRGHGWKEGLIFKITTVGLGRPGGDCCFGGRETNGVFEEYLEFSHIEDWRTRIERLK